MHGSAGEDIKPTKKAHLLGPARQEHFESAAIVRSQQDHRGSIPRMNHPSSVACLETKNQCIDGALAETDHR
jgi:hypothetical protein